MPIAVPIQLLMFRAHVLHGLSPGQAQVVDRGHSAAKPHGTDPTSKVPKWFRKGEQTEIQVYVYCLG